MTELNVIEICAGAGGQALGLEQAGFHHELAIELDQHAASTLRSNLGSGSVREGDVADVNVWDPREYVDAVQLLAGGVPCPPFSIAGKQRGAIDERDLFAWAIEAAGVMRPRALLLENVRGLSTPRFASYRQHVLNRLEELGYLVTWKLLNASDFGVPQLRPRFVLVALRPEAFRHFTWPKPELTAPTVGSVLFEQMASLQWEHAAEWASLANGIAPTIVGGSKKHGGADLGPSRAKASWRLLGVDGSGVANTPPEMGAPSPGVRLPKLTVDMVARLQGWENDDPAHTRWLSNLAGGKTARYRQLGNAFPPPVARAVGLQLAKALRLEGQPNSEPEIEVVHDRIYQAMRSNERYQTANEIIRASGENLDLPAFERRLTHLAADFEIEKQTSPRGPVYKLGEFKAFVGQSGHERTEFLLHSRSKVS